MFPLSFAKTVTVNNQRLINSVFLFYSQINMENNEYKILLVDDEEDILELLGYNLTKEGYQIFKAANGKVALTVATEIVPDMIILDVMMPEMDGIETCHELKKIAALKHTIIAFLTARSEDYSQIAGLEAGADDYILKPIKPRVFISRVKALFRRFEIKEESVNKVTIANMVVDREKFTIIKDGEEIILPKKQFELLWLLLSKVNKVFTRLEIFTYVWGDSQTGSRTIDVHIVKLREKLKLDNIKTVKGVGYKFEV